MVSGFSNLDYCCVEEVLIFILQIIGFLFVVCCVELGGVLLLQQNLEMKVFGVECWFDVKFVFELQVVVLFYVEGVVVVMVFVSELVMVLGCL